MHADRSYPATLVRFSAAGAGSFVVNLAIFAAGVRILDLAPQVSAACSFVVAVAVGYLLNRLWTFPTRRARGVATQAGRYLAISFASLAAGLLALSVLLEAGVDPVGAQAIAIAALMPIRFAVTRAWSFG